MPVVDSLVLADRLATGVDAVGVEARAARLAARSIKAGAKRWGIDLAIRCCDLTTLEGTDSPGKIARMAAKARRPSAIDPSVPPVAALCVYPRLVPAAVDALRGSSVAVASVATAFPSGQAPLDIRLAEVRGAVADGAAEIDMVVSRGALLAGDEASVYDEVARVRDVAGDAHLKVILETGELGSYEVVRRAALVAMAAGADMIKTSTGKIAPAATLPVAVVMAEAIRDVAEATGRAVGLKVAGGVRTTKEALRYLVVVNETLGPDWLDPTRFRIGASSLLNDLLMQRDRLAEGAYVDPDRYSVD